MILVFLLAVEEASTGYPGPLGRFGLRFRHVMRGVNTCLPIMHCPYPQRPPTTSLRFAGRGENIWSTTEPEVEVNVRWDNARIYATPWGELMVISFLLTAVLMNMLLTYFRSHM